MHHANALIGRRPWAYAYISLDTSGENPDISVREYERMSIADVRALIHDAMLRPVREEYRTFYIVADSILSDAQNALLKLFEEPNAHTCFYLIIPREEMLLPTLRSRIQILAIEGAVVEQDIFSAFQKLGYRDRLALITEKLKAEEFAWVEAVMRGFIYYAHTSRDADYIRDALMLATYAPTPGSSKKMLLEHIALTL